MEAVGNLPGLQLCTSILSNSTSPFSAEVIGCLETAVIDANATRYLNGAGLVILLYDHFLTFYQEVQYIWQAKSSLMKKAFLLNRYLVPSVLIMIASFMNHFGNSNIEDSTCSGFFIFSTLVGMVSMSVGNLFVLLRVVTLWGRNQRKALILMVGFLISFCVTLSFAIVIAVKMLSKMVYVAAVHMCVTPNKIGALTGMWASILLFELLVLILVGWNAFDRPRSRDTNITRVLAKDGVWVFVILATLRMFNLVLSIVVGPGLVVLGVYFVWAMTTVTLNRAVLSVHRNAAKDSERALVSDPASCPQTRNVVIGLRTIADKAPPEQVQVARDFLERLKGVFLCTELVRRFVFMQASVCVFGLPCKALGPGERHFTPAWHAVNMGTGAISALFHVFPYGSNTLGMQVIAFFFLLLNLVFFVLLTLCAIARYVVYRGIWSTMIHHPVQSLYLGCIPMGFATLLISAVGIVHTYFGYGGETFLYGLWGLWWCDVAVSLVICFGQLHVMFTRQKHEMSVMTMVWLLPIVTLIVSSAAGCVVAQAMIPFDVPRVCLTVAVCMALVTIGITLAIAVFTIYLQRLIVHGLPEGITIFSAFLPLGPLGQSGYTFLLLGEISRDLFPLAGESVSNIFMNEMTPHVLYAAAWVVSFALWSFATCWLLLALLALGDVLMKNSLPFKVTFWGMIFPNGVYANLTIQLGDTIDSRILRVWGAIYAVFTFGLWLFAMYRTLPSVWDGSIFEAPCLAKPEQAEFIGEDPAQESVSSTPAASTRHACEPSPDVQEKTSDS
ncbi:hypothetical protein M0805_005798 [Coniferiporia weirii]|nr:hypothetical protein M0805_005798 [Coniferiporia weirii]